MVVHDLEGQGTKRLVPVNDGKFACLVALKVHLRLRLDLGRAREIIDNRIQYKLYALVLECRSTVGRKKIKVDRALADALLDGIDIGFFALEIFFHRFIILLHGSLNQLSAVLRGLFLQVLRDIGDFKVFRLAGIIPDVCLLAEDIDNSHKAVLKSNRQRHHQGIRGKDILYLVNHPVKVRPQAVKLVDKDQPGDP